MTKVTLFVGQYVNVREGFSFTFHDKSKKRLKKVVGWTFKGQYFTYWDPPTFGSFQHLIKAKKVDVNLGEVDVDELQQNVHPIFIKDLERSPTLCSTLGPNIGKDTRFVNARSGNAGVNALIREHCEQLYPVTNEEDMVRQCSQYSSRQLDNKRECETEPSDPNMVYMDSKNKRRSYCEWVPKQMLNSEGNFVKVDKGGTCQLDVKHYVPALHYFSKQFAKCLQQRMCDAQFRTRDPNIIKNMKPYVQWNKREYIWEVKKGTRIHALPICCRANLEAMSQQEQTYRQLKRIFEFKNEVEMAEELEDVKIPRGQRGSQKLKVNFLEDVSRSKLKIMSLARTVKISAAEEKFLKVASAVCNETIMQYSQDWQDSNKLEDEGVIQTTKETWGQYIASTGASIASTAWKALKWLISTLADVLKMMLSWGWNFVQTYIWHPEQTMWLLTILNHAKKAFCYEISKFIAQDEMVGGFWQRQFGWAPKMTKREGGLTEKYLGGLPIRQLILYSVQQCLNVNKDCFDASWNIVQNLTESMGSMTTTVAQAGAHFFFGQAGEKAVNYVASGTKAFSTVMFSFAKIGVKRGIEYSVTNMMKHEAIKLLIDLVDPRNCLKDIEHVTYKWQGLTKEWKWLTGQKSKRKKQKSHDTSVDTPVTLLGMAVLSNKKK
tara:strand:+ start:785 stop:2767 length:1983 start_codon:yes stop_codon:yes gene_type:complete